MSADLHRTRALPERPGRGHLVVPAHIVEQTSVILRRAGQGTPPHEGLVWWAGRQTGDDFLVLACVTPTVDSGPQHVFADEHAVGNASAVTRPLRLGVIAQVHSHPGFDTRHSDGDDDLILMPFPNMFSVVVARFGAESVLPSGGAGVHQYQDGQWVKVADAADVVVVVPAELPA